VRILILVRTELIRIDDFIGYSDSELLEQYSDPEVVKRYPDLDLRDPWEHKTASSLFDDYGLFSWTIQNSESWKLEPGRTFVEPPHFERTSPARVTVNGVEAPALAGAVAGWHALAFERETSVIGVLQRPGGGIVDRFETAGLDSYEGIEIDGDLISFMVPSGAPVL